MRDYNLPAIFDHIYDMANRFSDSFKLIWDGLPDFINNQGIPA